MNKNNLKIIVLCIVFMLIFTSCDMNNTMENNTSAETEKITDIITEGLTGTPTETPTEPATKAPAEEMPSDEEIFEESTTEESTTEEPTTEEPATEEPTTQEPTEEITTEIITEESTTEEIVTECAHDWAAATCTTPKTCSKCGATDGTAAGHAWNSANCTTPKTCSKCGTTEGTAAGHAWNSANCTTPKTCSNCGATEGTAAGHSWNSANCTTPKTCLTCGATEGTAAGHSWNSANCTTPKTCSKCGETEGKALGHSYDWSRTCLVCGNAKESDISDLDVDSKNLQGIMQNVFLGDTVYNETVMFINKGETKGLLFPIDEIISVQSFNGDKTYVEGRDYTIVDGKLHIPTTSTINIIGSSTYYNFTGTIMLYEKYNGINVPTYWGDANGMTMWQIRVTYKHTEKWDGFKQSTYVKQYEGLIRKLMAGDDVAFIFYGDSITCGASSSWYYSEFFAGKNDIQWSYSMLFTQALADMFGYTIRFIDCSALNPNMIKAPPANYVGGTRGTITYINPSVGGWKSSDGYNYFDTYVAPYIRQYGCDLLAVAFGMNDGQVNPELTAVNIKSIYDKARALDGDFYGLIISTMLPNNKSTNGWYANQYLQEEQLQKVVDHLNSVGVGTGFAKVTSITSSMLQKIDFRDYTGNNINHPNDFMHRIYAQTCLQAFIGYENMK